MKRFSTCLFNFFLSTSIFAEESLQQRLIQKILPEKWSEIKLQESGIKKIRKMIGKPKMIKEGREYYSKDKVKYPIALSFDPSKKLKSLSYKLTSGDKKINYTDLKNYLVDFKRELISIDDQSEFGRYIGVKIKEGETTLTLVFKNDDDESLHSLSWE